MSFPLKRVLLFNNTAVIGHHGCTLVNRRIETLCRQHGMDVIHRLPVHCDLTRIDPTQFDLMLANGEGTLHHSSKGAQAIASAGVWAANHGLPAALINTLYEENDAEIAEGVRHFSIVSARDRGSQRDLAKAGIEAGYVPDLSLTWHPPIRDFDTTGPVVYTDSTISDADELLFAAARKYKASYLPLKALPYGSGSPSAQNLKRRARFFFKRNLISHFSSAHYSARYRNAVPEFEAFAERIGQARLVVAGRFHAACLAIDLERPFCAIRSNSRKMEALLGECGLADRLIDTAELLRTPTDQLVKRFGVFNQAELDIVRLFRRRARDSSDELFARIAGLAR